ncbi:MULTISPECIES: DUF4381 domain-containing protein [Galbibacter]|uniref:DUF4381 domain-containing protein n=1 Tax=Galbibacter pacificus TaxID=2996052 RepID=A0ABT6FVB5_9FLAO|nr:DUF4381 domain-containing protein [Galbibacter pacificus]MDG3583878.1 DUF4381 domain-containing protein [Galbibacter pacificus]MDG3587204.1 DUF4381 domain-containing protein [Galbibacter pacificus]
MPIALKMQDTLAIKPADLKLAPLYEPERVPFTFETIGWKVLAIVLVVLACLIAYYLIKRYYKNAYRREAITKLNQAGSVLDILVIVKVVAMQTFGRETVGPLYGREWLEFLDDAVDEPLFAPYKEDIEEVTYRSNTLAPETRELILLNSKKWIRTHAR